MGFLMKLIPDEIKLPVVGGLGLLVGIAVCFYPAKWWGEYEESQASQALAAKQALERVQDMEKNNAGFAKLSDRDRCVAFMRDSGLRVDVCDKR